MVLLSDKHPIDLTIGQELPPTFHYAWVILRGSICTPEERLRFIDAAVNVARNAGVRSATLNRRREFFDEEFQWIQRHGIQGRHQDLVDVGAEALAIDRAVEDPPVRQPRDPHRGEKRAGLPAPAGGVVVDARATWCPAVPPKQIGGAAGFVQTHEVGDIPGRRRRVPRDPRGRDVRPIVFGRADCFF